ncbi:MAG TPA: hypothetical protein VGK06_01975 [Methanosarcina sp.]
MKICRDGTKSQRNLFGGLATRQASNLAFVIDGIKTRGKIRNSGHMPRNDDNVISTRNERAEEALEQTKDLIRLIRRLCGEEEGYSKSYFTKFLAHYLSFYFKFEFSPSVPAF